MNSSISLILILATACIILAFPQLLAAQTEPSFEQVKAGIDNGKIEAIWQAKRSGNRAFIPPLKRLLAKEKYERPDAVNALAVLEDLEAMQAVVCLTHAENPLLAGDAISGLDKIGGWFSIQLLVKLLDDTPPDEIWIRRVKKYIKESPNSFDTYIPPYPSQWALMTLAKVLPGLPEHVPVEPQGVLLEQADKWSLFFKDWIRSHEQSLQQLRPKGQGIDFSLNGCKSPSVRRMVKGTQKVWRDESN